MTHTVTGFKTIFCRHLDASIPTHGPYQYSARDRVLIMKVLNGVLRSLKQVDASNFEALQKTFASRINSIVHGNPQTYVTARSDAFSIVSISEERSIVFAQAGVTKISGVMARRAKEAFAWLEPYSASYIKCSRPNNRAII